MKKLISLLAAALLLFSAAGCSADTEEEFTEAVAGIYDMTALQEGDITYDQETAEEMMNGDYHLRLSEDGSGICACGSSQIYIEWGDGILTNNVTEYAYTYSDGTLYVTNNQYVQVFTLRDASEGDDVLPASEYEAEEAASGEEA